MSMPSNTNPKLAKIKEAASRKMTMVQRGTVFHALACESSRDFNRIMPFPKDDTTRPDLCAEFCKRRATGKPETRIQERGQVALSAWCPVNRLTGHSEFGFCVTSPPELNASRAFHQS